MDLVGYRKDAEFDHMHQYSPRAVLVVAFVVSFVLSAFNAYGQFHETIRTGRPGQSIGTFAVGKGIAQLQSGIDYFGTTGTQTGRGGLINNVFRYGFKESWEINGLIEGRTETLNGVPLSGLSTFEIGTRFHIHTGEGWVPNVGLQVRLRLPTQYGDYSIQSMVPRVTLAISERLSRKFFLILNWTESGKQEASVPSSFYTTNLSYSLTERLGIFIENFGRTSPDGWKIYLDGGFAYLLSPDLQLDSSASFGNNHGVNEWYLSAGVSWRTRRQN